MKKSINKSIVHIMHCICCCGACEMRHRMKQQLANGIQEPSTFIGQTYGQSYER
jgi:hypothetical protein